MDPFIREYKNENINATLVTDLKDFSTYIETTNYFKIIHTNIRSIAKNYDEMLCFLHQISGEFEIIVLTETNIVYDLQIFNMKGYITIYNDGNFNKCDGIIIFVKDTLNISHNIVYLGPIKCIEVEITHNNSKIVLTCIYKSPRIIPQTFNQELFQYLQTKKHINNHIITGDINIDLLSDEDYIEEYKNILNYFDFTSYINRYTRKQSKTCLDHFFVKIEQKQNIQSVESFVFDYDVTDHSPIALLFKVSKTNIFSEQSYQEKSFCKKYINHEQLRSDIRQESWNCVYDSGDINEATNNFVNKLKFYINKNTKIIKYNNKNKPKKKWITRGLLKSINEKNNIYKQLSQDPHNEILKERYKAYKNALTKQIKNAKKKYAQNFIDKNQNKSKALWEQVNNICGKTRPITKIEKITLENGDIVTNKLDISNIFNKHFSEVGEKYANKIISPSDYSDVDNFIENTMYLHPTDNIEVKTIINQLKSKKSPGYDNIRAETLKEISEEICFPIVYLINLCFIKGKFPDILKLGVIKPLYKSGSKEKINNYRPISLISSIAKIIEKIIKIRIASFLSKYNILSDNQFGFREGMSTEDAILNLTSYIYNAIDNKVPVLCIFVDLSKAFDTVSHTNLLRKLESYGMRGNIYNLIRSYLTGREQVVNIGGGVSEPRTVNYGVPQGTVLGPLLFTVYINSLLKINSKGKIISFADDTAILYTSETWELLQTDVKNDFINIERWFLYNKLTLNCDKTKYLVFSSYANNLPEMGPLKVGPNTTIPEAKSVQYLGIVIDRHLRWDLQIKYIIRKIRGLVSRFRYLKDYLDTKYLKILYYALVQSQLSYGIIGWGE